MTEREAIVAWLREQTADQTKPFHYLERYRMQLTADAIEAGQHLENKDG